MKNLIVQLRLFAAEFLLGAAFDLIPESSEENLKLKTALAKLFIEVF